MSGWTVGLLASHPRGATDRVSLGGCWSLRSRVCGSGDSLLGGLASAVLWSPL